jgi:hypothetical protein
MATKPRRGGVLAGFGVVDPHEAVHLHEPVPDAPDGDQGRCAVHLVPGEPEDHQEAEGRSQQEAHPEVPEQHRVAVGAQEPRQVVPGGEHPQHESGHEFGREDLDRQVEERCDQERCADDQQGVRPG